MTNPCFNVALTAIQNGSLNINNRLILNALRNYNEHPDCKYVVVNDVSGGISAESWFEFIQFMHTSGVVKFFYADSSTASLRGLYTLLNCRDTLGLQVSILGSNMITVGQKFGENSLAIGLLISIPRQRGLS